MQRSIKALGILLMLSNCGISQPNAKVSKIEYISVGWRIMTPARIDCNYFDTAFTSKAYVYSTISDSVRNTKFGYILDKIQFSDDEYGIDVRGKIYVRFFDSKDSTVICIGQNNLLKVNGSSILNNEEILSEIKELIGK